LAKQCENWMTLSLEIHTSFHGIWSHRNTLPANSGGSLFLNSCGLSSFSRNSSAAAYDAEKTTNILNVNKCIQMEPSPHCELPRASCHDTRTWFCHKLNSPCPTALDNVPFKHSLVIYQLWKKWWCHSTRVSCVPQFQILLADDTSSQPATGYVPPLQHTW